VTGPDFEALHYGLAQSTDWSAGTLHRAVAAAPAGPEADTPADAAVAADAGEEDLGPPGTLGPASSDDDVWGPITYGGARRRRPPIGRRRAAPEEADDSPGQRPPGPHSDTPGLDLPDLSGLAVGPAPSWDQLLDGAPAISAPQPDPLVSLDKGELPEPASAAALSSPVTLAPPSNKGLLASSRTMAIASLASRVTGFLRTAAIAAALGVVGSGVADAYNLANMLPNMVYELLIGGVLSSVLIPLLVGAQETDEDQGTAYTHRLLSVATVALGIATLIAAAGAPLLTWLLVESGPQRDLATVWATILLPEIFFYGVGALFTAVLNARHVYAAPAWAPVLNNVIILLTVALYLLLPGPTTLTPSSITTTQVLVLGIGTTLGIVVQALVLIPALRTIGFRWAWRFAAPAGSPSSSRGFAQERNLVGWVLGYVAVSQVGLLVISRVALANGGLTTFASADLLFQVPYGILGVSLLTALMPRLSRSAARGDYLGVLADLSLGTRLSALALLPVTAGLMVLGPSLGTVIFNYGQTPLGDARHVGIVLALASFGLFPFAVVMLQLRVFYAMHDARTPTLINLGMVAVKVTLVLAAAALFDGRHVVEALSVATSTSYVVGAILGHFLLERRLGALGLGAAVPTVLKIAGASVAGALVAVAITVGVSDVAGQGRIGAFATVLLGSSIGGAVLIGILWRLRLSEVQEIAGALRKPMGEGLQRVEVEGGERARVRRR
jgi:putative peptidoglycan lipid II flippase